MFFLIILVGSMVHFFGVIGTGPEVSSADFLLLLFSISGALITLGLIVTFFGPDVFSISISAGADEGSMAAAGSTSPVTI